MPLPKCLFCVSTTVPPCVFKVLPRRELLRIDIELNKVKKEYTNLKSIAGLFFLHSLSLSLSRPLSLSRALSLVLFVFRFSHNDYSDDATTLASA